MNSTQLFAITVLVLALTVSNVYGKGKGKRAAAYWNYENQDWEGECQTGRRQSPIDIDTDNVDHVHYDDVMWTHNATTFGMVTMKNNGHGFSVYGNNMGKMHLHGAGLDAEYVLAQFHYHWGPTDSDSQSENGRKRPNERPHHQGSEHRIDGYQYPAELHLVHYHSNFHNLTHAVKSKRIDALAVVGVLLAREVRTTKGFETNLLAAVKNITNDGQEAHADFSAVTIGDLVPDDRTDFWRYDGSLTTPGCNEQVIWTVLKEDMTISSHLLDGFVHLEDKEGHELNYTGRDPQPLYGRRVEHNMGIEHVSDSGSTLLPTFIPLVALLNLLRAFVF